MKRIAYGLAFIFLLFACVSCKEKEYEYELDKKSRTAKIVGLAKGNKTGEFGIYDRHRDFFDKNFSDDLPKGYELESVEVNNDELIKHINISTLPKVPCSFTQCSNLESFSFFAPEGIRSTSVLFNGYGGPSIKIKNCNNLKNVSITSDVLLFHDFNIEIDSCDNLRLVNLGSDTTFLDSEESFDRYIRYYDDDHIVVQFNNLKFFGGKDYNRSTYDSLIMKSKRRAIGSAFSFGRIKLPKPVTLLLDVESAIFLPIILQLFTQVDKVIFLCNDECYFSLNTLSNYFDMFNLESIHHSHFPIKIGFNGKIWCLICDDYTYQKFFAWGDASVSIYDCGVSDKRFIELKKGYNNNDFYTMGFDRYEKKYSLLYSKVLDNLIVCL